MAVPRGPDWWVSGKTGALSPWAQAQVWALSKLAKEKKVKLSQAEIAKSVVKVGGGHPNQQTISALLAEFLDESWYPGKREDSAATRGPKRQMTGQKQQAISRAAKALKRDGVEPSVPAVIERCPTATKNPRTNAPFDKNMILNVFRTQCFDDGAEQPWGHIPPYMKTALPPEQVQLRLAWGKAEQRKGRDASWYFRNVIWMDPCSSVLSEAPKTSFDEHQATYTKGKRWISPDKRATSRNLQASPYATKHCRNGDKRVWWFVVVARGSVQFKVMEDGWRQNGDGMATMVSHLDGILRKMVGRDGRLPRVVVTDRGPGFFQTSTGHVTQDYQNALTRGGFRLWAGDDASRQPADMPDLFPHETAVAWTRKYLKDHPLQKGRGLESLRKQLVSTLSDCADHINKNYDVDGLSRCFPRRVKALVDAKGERLRS